MAVNGESKKRTATEPTAIPKPTKTDGPRAADKDATTQQPTGLNRPKAADCDAADRTESQKPFGTPWEVFLGTLVNDQTR